MQTNQKHHQARAMPRVALLCFLLLAGTTSALGLEMPFRDVRIYTLRALQVGALKKQISVVGSGCQNIKTLASAMLCSLSMEPVVPKDLYVLVLALSLFKPMPTVKFLNLSLSVPIFDTKVITACNNVNAVCKKCACGNSVGMSFVLDAFSRFFDEMRKVNKLATIGMYMLEKCQIAF